MFLVEVGLYGDILIRDSKKFGSLATDLTWFQNLWEYASHLKVAITLSDESHLKPVREGNRSLMGAFAGVGFEGKELQRLGRMKNNKKVLHVLDLVKCNGETIDKGLVEKLVDGESTHTFPLEKPTRANVRLWDEAITRICLPTFKLARALGPYLCLGHRYQHWFRSEDGLCLYYHHKGSPVEEYDEYLRDDDSYATQHGQRYRWVGLV